MKHPNRNRIISYLLMILGIAIAGISAIIRGVEPLHTMFYIGAALAVIGIIYGLVSVRCPYCKRLLHLRGIMPEKVCPYCGKTIAQEGEADL